MARLTFGGGGLGVLGGLGDWPIMENQMENKMENKMENEMETGGI